MLALSIASRYNVTVTLGISAREYQLFAELYCHIRRFLRDADDMVPRAGVSPQQYLVPWQTGVSPGDLQQTSNPPGRRVRDKRG